MVADNQVFLILRRWRKTGKRWQVFSHTQQKDTKGMCWKSTDLWVSVQKWTMPTGKPIEVCLHHPTCVPSSLLLAQRPISVATTKQIPLEESIVVAFMCSYMYIRIYIYIMSFHQVGVLSNISGKQDNPTTRFNDVKNPKSTVNIPWRDIANKLKGGVQNNLCCFNGP